MFKRLFTRGSHHPPPSLDTDIAQDDLELRAARQKALAGDWTAARDIVLAAGRDWELRGRRITVLAGVAGEGGWFEKWIQAAPDDPAAATIAASLLSDRAGEARGAASAANTSREQFAAFAMLSAQAEQASRRAVTLAPDDPTPWGIILSSHFADGYHHREDFAEALAEGTRRDPHNFDLHLMAVSFYCEKWYGSHEQMFAAARSAAAAAPPGASTAMLPFLAHFEYAMREYSWDTRTDDARNECRRYFQRSYVQHELDAAVAKWRAGGPRALGRSMTCRHWQALGYVLSGRRDEARAVLDEIGPFLGSTPVWGYFWLRQGEGYQAAWNWAHQGR